MSKTAIIYWSSTPDDAAAESCKELGKAAAAL